MTEDRDDNDKGRRPETDEGPLFDRGGLRKKLESGLDQLLAEARNRGVIGKLELPREIASHLSTSIDETKDAALKIVGRELRGYLDRVDISELIQKLMTDHALEIKAEIRLVPKRRDDAAASADAPEEQPKDR